ncbi:MAG: extradiol ring-cleavage dioxygenase [Alphaproteobacteria bacterium]|nr:extradiol ring-cleavage dioxygenase [Alphaproteobacteria bacterium]
MAELLGLGLSHFGGFMFGDEDMSARAKARLADGSLSPDLDAPEKWPAPMRAEWGNDEGAGFAAMHRRQYFEGLKRIRTALDEFQPDAVIIFGDDQYECFKEDLIPAYCVFLGEAFKTKPYLRARGLGGDTPNIWNDPFDLVLENDGAPNIARVILNALLEEGFDPAYSYTLPHQEFLGHAFANTLLFLDHERKGWPYPIIPFAINAYGSALIRAKGGLVEGKTSADGAAPEPDPPGPTPKRCFELGRAIGRVLLQSPWRIALVASASFSHGFLTEKHEYLYPDLDADLARYEELRSGNYLAWRDLKLGDLEEAGQHELVNWCPMVGAMEEAQQKPAYCEFLQSFLMNSNKCVAVIPPAATG